MSEDKSGYVAAQRAGELLQISREVAGKNLEVPVVLAPQDFQAIELENFMERPTRKRACPGFIHEAGFDDYVKDHMTEASRIFADAENHTMTAILDMDQRNRWAGAGEARELEILGLPDWRGHRAAFTPPKDADWLTWLKHDGHAMAQIDFAEFLEDMVHTIVKPDGAELREIALNFEAVQATAFKSVERLQDGSRVFHYDDSETTTKVGKQQVEVPESFTLRLPVFYRDDAIEMVAKLRYRIGGQGLVLLYKLHRPDLVADECFAKLMEGVRVETGLPVYLGTPEI